MLDMLNANCFCLELTLNPIWLGLTFRKSIIFKESIRLVQLHVPLLLFLVSD